MSVEETLARADEDLRVGRAPLARRRLRGLVASFPERLDLRDRLAELYRREGELAQAGRWSYLAEDPDALERAAFERAYRHDPVELMSALRWRGPEDSAGTRVARARLAALRALAEEQAGRPVDWADPHHRPVPPVRWSGRLADAAVVTVLLVALGLIGLGLVSLLARGVAVVVDRFG